MTMETFDEGTVALLDVQEGEDIALGQRVLVLAKKGEDPAAVAKSAAEPVGKGNGPKEESVAVPQGLRQVQEVRPRALRMPPWPHAAGDQRPRGLVRGPRC